MKALLYPPTQGSGVGEHFRLTTGALRELGVEIVPASEAPDSFHPDLVHIFDAPDIFTAPASFVRARDYGVPIFVSPIYWNVDRFYQEGLPQADPPQGEMAGTEQNLRDAFRRAEHAGQRLLFGHAAMLNPSSPSEAALLTRDFGVPAERLMVAWSGVKPLFRDAAPNLFREKYGVNEFVLCAARFEIRKNQLALVRALRDEPLTLVFAGGELAPGYRTLCERTAQGHRLHLMFLPFLPSEVLASAYAAARVHALASWYDCAPQAALEAAASGCAMVMTTESGIRDYLGQDASYCDPADIEGLRRAVLTAWETPPSERLRNKMFDEFTWLRSGEQTLGAYKQAVVLQNPTDDSGYRADLEQAWVALSELARLQQETRTQLWQEKEMLARQVNGYAQGRVMRALSALEHFTKRK